MSAFLTELGRRVAERWLAIVVFPGLLYVGVLLLARTTGWTHALDPTWLINEIDGWMGKDPPRTRGFLVLLVTAAMLGSVGVGVAAPALGGLIARVWLAERWHTWPRPLRALASRRTASRREAHRRALDALGRVAALGEVGLGSESTLEQSEQLRGAYRTLAAIAPKEPERPTRMGDRLAGVTTALYDRYGIDLPTVWPCLWLTLPANAIKEINEARDLFHRASTLAGWSVLYLLPAAFWWPGLAISSVLWILAIQRANAAVDAYALFVAAAVELHTPSLARTLGIGTSDVLDREMGTSLTQRLQR